MDEWTRDENTHYQHKIWVQRQEKDNLMKCIRQLREEIEGLRELQNDLLNDINDLQISYSTLQQENNELVAANQILANDLVDLERPSTRRRLRM